MRNSLFAFFLILFSCFSVFGQDILKLSLVKADVTYGLNEDIIIKVEVNEPYFSDLKNKEVTISYGTEGSLAASYASFSHVLNKKGTEIAIKGISEAQILRIKATVNLDKKTFTKEIGVAIAPENLIGTVSKPVDFDSFWQRQKDNLKSIDLEPTYELDDKLSTDRFEVYQISYKIDNNGSRFYGVLTIPKGSHGAKYPAVVVYPGAGVRGYTGESRFVRDSIITLQIGVHGIPVNLPQTLYTSLASGSLDGYQYYNLQSKEKYYFNRVIKGSLRALDFLETVKEFDGKNIMANGSSQGGALSLIVTSLDNRVKGVAVYCPAMCQTNGSLFGKATGWPKPMQIADMHAEYANNWKNVIPYYDVVNFARNISVPVFMTFGMIDDVTPATTIFSAYNVIPSEKEYYLKEDVQHANHPSQIEAVNMFIVKKIK